MMVKEGSQYYNYKYNADGIRIRKNANGITYTYLLDDSGNLIGEKRVGPGVNLRLTYEYDATGILAFGFSDTITGQRGKLYYQKNLQGDVIGINWASGITACIYDYDAWGNVILKSGDAYILGLNRILYRGYYQDIETGWYYLQSRYYDPTVCRFINADSIDYLDTESIDGLNLYSYCSNNPGLYFDPTGHAQDFANFIKGAFRIVAGVLAITLGVTALMAGGLPSIMLLSVLALALGSLSTVNGAADIGESFTGSNFIRDGIMGGNQGLYDLYGGLVDFATAAVTIRIGIYANQNYRMRGYVEGSQRTMYLKPGKTVQRFGEPHGRYMTNYGAQFNRLALRPGTTPELHTYKVMKPLKVRSGHISDYVWKEGPSKGGGRQYFSWRSVQRLIDHNYLQEIF